MISFKTGDRAFMLENNRNVHQVTILNCFGGIYTVRLPGGGASKVKAHRLFATPEEAHESMHRRKQPTFRMSGTMYT
mgnify:CR=1 FL=1